MLDIATYPDETLELISSLKKITYLRILHLPNISDLSPLAALQNLQSLSLATLPSWDASGKVTVVESLEPLVRLPKLRHLELFGVRPKDKSLRPLYGIKSLETGRFSKYPRKEIEAFYAQTHTLNKFVPEPSFEKA